MESVLFKEITMKKDRNSRFVHRELYLVLDKYQSIEDTRYWGVFYCGQNNTVKIDPKRYQKMLVKLDDKILKVINSRHTHLFEPRKENHSDYNCNLLIGEINSLKSWWRDFKGLIKRELKRVKKPNKVYASDNYNMMCGITSVGAANAWANFTNCINKANYDCECASLVQSLYAQYFHVMASQIEASLIRVLDRNGVIEDKFNRNFLYGTLVNKEKTLDDLDHYLEFDKLYCIWNFIKHNSLSTYNKLKTKYPELLSGSEFQQGELAFLYIKFSDKLIEDILDGCGQFFKDYCHVVFNEDFDEAQWNYVRFFTEPMEQEIESCSNPLGLGWWDDVD